MKRLVFLLSLMILLISSVSYAKQNDPIKITEQFFTMIKDGKINQAYDMLLKNSTGPVSKPDAIKLLQNQTASGLKIYGAVLGHEKITMEKFGGSITRLVYVLKSERMPIVWEFYFYKPKDKWHLAGIKFNDQFQEIESKKKFF
ncbi:MAG: hypothetical protein GY874_23030 [Desulfobacteraceae bacterium]|nr:hypothetical protein [Desulfobacteraceae bacterium]